MTASSLIKPLTVAPGTAAINTYIDFNTLAGNLQLAMAVNLLTYTIPTQFEEGITYRFTIGTSGRSIFASSHWLDITLLDAADSTLVSRSTGVAFHSEGGVSWHIFPHVIFEYTIPSGPSLQTFKIDLQKRGGAGDVALNFYHARKVRQP